MFSNTTPAKCKTCGTTEYILTNHEPTRDHYCVKCHEKKGTRKQTKNTIRNGIRGIIHVMKGHQAYLQKEMEEQRALHYMGKSRETPYHAGKWHAQREQKEFLVKNIQMLEKLVS